MREGYKSVQLGGQSDYDDTSSLEWSQTGNQSGPFVYKKKSGLS